MIVRQHLRYFTVLWFFFSQRFDLSTDPPSQTCIFSGSWLSIHKLTACIFSFLAKEVALLLFRFRLLLLPCCCRCRCCCSCHMPWPKVSHYWKCDSYGECQSTLPLLLLSLPPNLLLPVIGVLLLPQEQQQQHQPHAPSSTLLSFVVLHVPHAASPSAGYTATPPFFPHRNLPYEQKTVRFRKEKYYDGGKKIIP